MKLTIEQALSFGNYLLSEEREQRVGAVNERTATFTDIENWKASENNARPTETSKTFDGEL